MRTMKLYRDRGDGVLEVLRAKIRHGRMKDAYWGHRPLTPRLPFRRELVERAVKEGWLTKRCYPAARRRAAVEFVQ